MKHLVYTFLILCATATLGIAQNQAKQIEALNNYVQFMNESTHGMLIIHRLLENFNQETNKFVDVDRYKINNYSNKDLPKDIFLDTEHWFYEISPVEYYQIAKQNAHVLNSDDVYQMNFVIKAVSEITKKTNQLRFDVEAAIKSGNLNDTTSLRKVYNLLEDGTKLYDDYYKQQLALEALVKKQNIVSDSEKNISFYNAFKKIYSPLRSVMSNIRDKNESDINNSIHQYKSNLSGFTSQIQAPYFNNRILDRKLEFILEKTAGAQKSMEDFLLDPQVPVEYITYGKNYYYHNANLANKTNKYGNGFVVEVNKIITRSKMSQIMFFEIPHFYKVIYPKKELTWRKRDYLKDKPKKIAKKKRKSKRRRKRQI